MNPARSSFQYPLWVIAAALIVVFGFLLLDDNRLPKTTQPNILTAAGRAEVAGEIPTPAGYQRKAAQSGSFAAFLRRLPLKPAGAPVLLYNGSRKPDQSMVYRTVNLPLSRRNLHQCADAVIRLKALYEFERKNYSAIRFHFTSGHLFRFDRYAAGWYPKISGSKVTFQKRKPPGKSKSSLDAYLRIVYTYAGTLSLNREMNPIAAATARPGDVFVQGGSPGHAVIIIDESFGPAGRRKLLLGQSYMPAQELHVLKAPGSDSPWHNAPVVGNKFVTREWTFPADSVKRFDL